MNKPKLVIAALVLGTTPALAQQKTYHLQVNESDLAALSKSLGKAPYEEVAPIIQRLSAQVQQQLQARQAPQQPAAVASQPAAPSASSLEDDLKAKGKARPNVPAEYGKPVPQVAQ